MTTTFERLAPRARPPSLSNVGPNWFATVMGTGVVAVAAATLPVQSVLLHDLALVAWLLAVIVLVTVTSATAGHWLLHPDAARAHLRHPVMGNFYGAAPMGLLTVGTGAVLVGRDVLGLHAALVVAWCCWVVGTVAGVACALIVPRLTYPGGPAFAGWLMPVVPPMVSAAAGAVLVGHLGRGRDAMLAVCWALFVLALIPALVVIVRVVQRVTTHGVGPAALVPTLWIVLGPLGQSITAAHALGTVGPGRRLALAYGVVAWIAAVAWLGVAAALSWRARPPFGLPWWSLTFPVGTVVTGTSALAAATRLAVFSWSAVALFVGLVGAWAVVATTTARHARRLLA